MPQPQIGKLKRRYSFLLNPHAGTRLSKCPKCDRLTHPRKFALFIDIEGSGPIIVGKTCQYCTACELIMAHCDELEEELADGPMRFIPTTPGTGYFVIGTVDKKTWQAGLGCKGTMMEKIFANMADFKEHFHLHFQPAGWYREDD